MKQVTTVILHFYSQQGDKISDISWQTLRIPGCVSHGLSRIFSLPHRTLIKSATVTQGAPWKNQMKGCHTCNRTYTDESLLFCADDGTQLVSEAAPAEPYNAPPSTQPTIAFGLTPPASSYQPTPK